MLQGTEIGAPTTSTAAVIVIVIVIVMRGDRGAVCGFASRKLLFNGCWETDAIFLSRRGDVFLNVKLCLSGKAFSFEGKSKRIY